MTEIKKKPKKQLSPEKLEAKKKRDTARINELLAFAVLHFFIRLTKKERQDYITKVVPLEPPKDKREEDADNQVVLKLELGGYVIWLYTAYLEEEEMFAEDKAIQIVVTKASRPGGKKHYIHRFHSSPYTIRNVCFGILFIIDRLRLNRPILLGKPADIHWNEKEAIHEWRSVYKKRGGEQEVETKTFYQSLPQQPSGLIKFIYKHRDEQKANVAKRILEKRKPLNKIKRKRAKLPINRNKRPVGGVIKMNL